MFSNHFTTNLSQNAAVKKIANRSIFTVVFEPNFVAYFFGTPCIIPELRTAFFRTLILVNTF